MSSSPNTGGAESSAGRKVYIADDKSGKRDKKEKNNDKSDKYDKKHKSDKEDKKHKNKTPCGMN